MQELCTGLRSPGPLRGEGRGAATVMPCKAQTHFNTELGQQWRLPCRPPVHEAPPEHAYSVTRMLARANSSQSLRAEAATCAEWQALPYALCAEAHFGGDADLVGFEMGPMGHDDPGDGSVDEIFMRQLFDPSRFSQQPSMFWVDSFVSNKEMVSPLPTWCTDACDNGRNASCHYEHSNLNEDPGCKFERCEACASDWKARRPHDFSYLPMKWGKLLQHYKEYGTAAMVATACTGPRSSFWTYSGTKLIQVAKAKNYARGWHPGACRAPGHAPSPLLDGPPGFMVYKRGTFYAGGRAEMELIRWHEGSHRASALGP
ncbi:hypothetical protein CYMTET_31286 [Cymbomonas tetramitiformis]|uniref:Uncharacterized protein n=1 Tax=Cymbomonas tetramitiformis TaxID=36881 RepID=A0AAE0KQX5_9CHLO|nr:hypothetical protein CYMTET_33410 [Cymbomonas tetramitiformis]KAK3259729.1 hypothetical protein CYMTET_31286 [Cymbomonas tetramitiformis]